MKTKRDVPNTKAMKTAAFVSVIGGVLALLDPGQGIKRLELHVCLQNSSDCLHVEFGAGQSPRSAPPSH